MGFVTRQQIKSNKLNYEDAIVPEWPDDEGQPGTVRIWQLPADEAIAMSMTQQSRPKTDSAFIVFMFCAKNEDGTERLYQFDDSVPEEIAAVISELKLQPLHIMQRLSIIGMRLNHMQMGDLAAIKKLLSEAPSGAKPMTSPVSSVA
jgi:hypothetical protein